MPTTESLVHGWRQDGRHASTMLEACTDSELRAFCLLASKLGLLPDATTTTATGGDGSGTAGAVDPGAPGGDGGAGGFKPALHGPPDAEALGAMARPQLEELLLRVGAAEALAPPALPSAPAPASVEGPGQPEAQAAQAGSSQQPPAAYPHLRQQLPAAAAGDFMHPYVKLLLQRPPTAYVLNPTAGTSSLLDSAQDEADEGAGGVGAPAAPAPRDGALATGAPPPAPSAAAPTPAPAASAPAAGPSSGLPPAPLQLPMSPVSTMPPPGPLSPPPSATTAAAAAAKTAAPTPAPATTATAATSAPPPDVPPTPSGGLTPSTLSGPDGGGGHGAPSGADGGAGPNDGVGGAGDSDKPHSGGAAGRSGRARASINYSIMAGKKEKVPVPVRGWVEVGPPPCMDIQSISDAPCPCRFTWSAQGARR